MCTRKNSNQFHRATHLYDLRADRSDSSEQRVTVKCLPEQIYQNESVTWELNERPTKSNIAMLRPWPLYLMYRLSDMDPPRSKYVFGECEIALHS